MQAQAMQEIHVETPKQLLDLCERIRGSRWLALDTEFMREKTYYPKFCLLQLCNGETAASIDPITLHDLEPLLEIIYDPSVLKVWHSARQDLEIFHHLWHELPAPLFDTQLAATLIGLGDQVGYGNLVGSILGHNLDKGHTRTDWSLRPLEKPQLRYALDDVIYLGELYLNLDRRLRELQRDQWLEEDFATLADPSTYINVPEDAWQRIKGRQKLKGAQLAVLRSLAAWRETSAMKADRPRRWILKDEVMVELARRQPGNAVGLERVRGLEAGTLKRHGNELLELIGAAARLPKSQWPGENNLWPRLSSNQDAQVDLLMCSLRLLSEKHRITPTAICNRRELEALVCGGRDLDLLHGWRRALAGEALLQVLEGKCSPSMENGRLTLTGLP
jgi:ribonuclease D